MKEKYILLILPFKILPAAIEISRDLIENLNKNFKNFFLVNSENINFFKKKIYDYSFQEYETFKIFNPKNSNELLIFCENKNIVVINNFGRDYGSLRLHLILKKLKIPQVMISHIGNIATGTRYDFFHPILLVKEYFIRTFFKKFILFLIIIKFINQIQIRFISGNLILNKIKKNFFKNFLYCNNFFYAKKIVPINSRSYDFFLSKKNSVSEDYIIHLDAYLNYKHETDVRGTLPSYIIDKHYFYLNNFLEKLSNSYKKEVIVCVHPKYNLNYHQNYFKKFRVVQFQTRKYIYKSFLVCNFDSSAIIDAVVLKKKIIGLTSHFMGKNEFMHSKGWSNNVGYKSMDIIKDCNFDSKKLLKVIQLNIFNYDQFLKDYHIVDERISSNQKIIQGIKEVMNLKK